MSTRMRIRKIRQDTGCNLATVGMPRAAVKMTEAPVWWVDKLFWNQKRKCLKGSLGSKSNLQRHKGLVV